MSWINLQQLDKCNQGNSKVTKVSGTVVTHRAKVNRALEGHIAIADFFRDDTRVSRPLKGAFWQRMREANPDWFTCVNPGNSVQKIFVLKNEFIPQAQVILEEYVEKYKHTLWKHY